MDWHKLLIQIVDAFTANDFKSISILFIVVGMYLLPKVVEFYRGVKNEKLSKIATILDQIKNLSDEGSVYTKRFIRTNVWNVYLKEITGINFRDNIFREKFLEAYEKNSSMCRFGLFKLAKEYMVIENDTIKIEFPFYSTVSYWLIKILGWVVFIIAIIVIFLSLLLLILDFSNGNNIANLLTGFLYLAMYPLIRYININYEAAKKLINLKVFREKNRRI